jgi:membrane protease YdiL (CAAX protease family)
MVALAFGHDPTRCDGWLGVTGAASLLLSLGLGVCVATLTVASTRVLVRRAAWARALHEALRPTVKGAGDGWLFAIAVASALGEELLFRGLLVPAVGVVLSSLLFGALHQVRGEARWGWAAWASGMGLLFAIIFAATGSLAGPVIGHLAINAANLRFLRDTDPAPRRRALGGLLSQR